MEGEVECKYIKAILARMRSDRDILDNVQRQVQVLRELYEGTSRPGFESLLESWTPENPMVILVIYLAVNVVIWMFLVFACCSFSDQVRKLRYECGSRANVLSTTVKDVQKIAKLMDPESESLIASRIERLVDGSQRGLGFYQGLTAATWRQRNVTPSPSLTAPRDPPLATSSLLPSVPSLDDVEEEVCMADRSGGSTHTVTLCENGMDGASVRFEARRSLCSTS